LTWTENVPLADLGTLCTSAAPSRMYPMLFCLPDDDDDELALWLAVET
jgi:hypothetical protein